MKTYRYDLHVHTRETSGCGRVPARRVVDLYREIGYHGLVITDHYLPEFFARLGRRPWPEKVARFLAGYRAALARGREVGLRVFFGLELRFADDPLDYLIYGIDEDFLLAYPELLTADLATLHDLAKAGGFLVYQAHPFRSGSSPAPPELLDGVEVYNGNPRHDSRNHLALAFARRHGLRMSSGSDFHQPEDLGRGGIEVTEELIRPEELVTVLRRQDFHALLGLATVISRE
ncbi:MAG: transposase [Firmicutes bacterium]|nr:transposase [Bacillota bacterium]